MCESRARGSCTKMNLNGKIVIVTAGGISDSVELLDPLANDGWIPGKTKKIFNFYLSDEWENPP